MADAAPIDAGTRLAVDRTRLAYERTLMAWVRTAASMISFGFTIYKFFQFELKDRPIPQDAVLGPRGFGLIMIVIGLAALLLSTVQHRHSMQLMRQEYPGVPVPGSTAAIVAGVFSLLGLIALLAVIFQV
jgi:putative membrane protein